MVTDWPLSALATNVPELSVIGPLNVSELNRVTVPLPETVSPTEDRPLSTMGEFIVICEPGPGT